MAQSDIVIRGAREHNLRDVNLRLPRNKLICMTGVSGSGKSSLAFDTLYAEGQRRYVESLSSYARQFLGQMPKPDVDAVSGLAPSISIQQKMRGRNPRSTVGTITEIYDYLRVLFARVGQGQCETCGKPIAAQSTEQIIESVARLPEKTRFQVLAPVVQGQKGEYRDLFEDLLKQGYLRARVDGSVVELTDNLQLDRQMRHNIEVVVDRLIAGKANRSRLAEAVESALKLSGGTLIVSLDETSTNKRGPKAESGKRKTDDRLYSSHYACTDCGISYETPSPQLFSFNSPQGMCIDCTGLGMMHTFVLERLVSNEKKTIAKGAIELLGPVRKIGKWRRHILQAAAGAIEDDLDLPADSMLKTPWHDLPQEAQQLFLYGMGDRHITFSWRYSGGLWKHGGTWNGVIPDLLDDYRKTGSPMRRRQLEKYMEIGTCATCRGARLNAQARNVRITSTSLEMASGGCQPPVASRKKKASKRLDPTGGSRPPLALNLPEFCGLSIADAFTFLQQLELDETQQFIAGEAIKEIGGRLGFLLKCGLDYLTLDRSAPTLSGGESQRIRLAGQIGCGLVGVVYILDEPSIGLHPRDNEMLLDSLCDLRDQGNTVIVVEHDEETMRAADHIVDFGPGPGVRGGEVVVEGSLTKVHKEKRSLTGQYLSGKLTIPIPDERRKPSKKQLKVVGAQRNNLKNIDVSIPLGNFICVTGVSGSGKSSLVNDILWPVLNRELNGGKGNPGQHKRVNGLHHLDKAIDINQSPIGRTPRSNPATYVKLFDQIRDLFTKLPESKIRGYKPGRFSFNVEAGRCEACEGYGSNKLEMDFLADIWVTCPVCSGHRFNRETREVRFKGANVADVLEMDVQEAIDHFGNVPKILKLLKALHDVGLDYVKLGQPSPTLSGGEAQRIKLARELGKRSTGQTIYLLDEPTTGLHFADISKLLEVLHGFVDEGNTVLVVEHNLDVIKTADWVIDLGPEGGAGGGQIVAAGTPEEIAANPDSHTGRALAPVLQTSGGRKAPVASRKNTRSNGKDNRGLTPPARQRNTREIVVRGAGQHNLKQIDVNIPRDRMSVFCGPSGSGKSSLAMDTLYAEGQRRYVESLSAYARQFLGQMPKPRVEHIHGLSPAIAIEQKTTGTTPRSTVGTVTEVYDYLRILFARLGDRYCPDCHIPVETQTTDQVIDKILAHPSSTKLVLLAPQEIEVGQKYERLWERLKTDGFLRVRINGTTYRLEDVPDMDRRRKHNVEVVIDRITVNKKSRSRIADSVEAALTLGHGVMHVAHCDDERLEEDWRVDPFSLHFACHQCHRSFEELTPNHFSFNSPLGWCDSCEGLGIEHGTNLAALIGHDRATLLDGAISAWPSVADSPLFRRMLESMANQFGIPLDVPFNQLDSVHRRMVLYGTGDRWVEVKSQETRVKGKKEQPASASGSRPSTLDSRLKFQYKGLYPAIDEASRVSYVHRRQLYELVGETDCSACDGSRLRDDAGAVRFRGKTLAQVSELPLSDALGFLKAIKLKGDDRKVAGDLLTEATSRLTFLVDVGLHYLTLSRTLPSLSGGETQRIRLAGQIGRALTGVLYVLDEPTIGLHPRDNGRLLSALQKLRDLGNTLVLVEHDREVLGAADQLFDFGPGAGRFGGTVVGKGTPKQLQKRRQSLTGQYLADKREISVPATRRINPASGSRKAPVASKKKTRSNGEDNRGLTPPARLETPGGGWLELLGARQNNLREVDLRIPLGTFTCITGVSGSGKSSLIEDTLGPVLAKKLHRASETPGPFNKLRGIEKINKVIAVDQQPLGSTPASNPATYTGVFDHIRDLFTRLPEAKVRGYRPARFSFNRPGGRCDDCEGNGQRCIEMHFLPDVWVECETCRGKRYNTETLAVQYRGKSIADVLEMSIGEAHELFENIPKIRRYLATLCAIGLDYLTLGQSAPTLSGGEAQRVKLASELARPSTGRTLYLLDEPTTGLHFDDIAKLLKVLDSLVELGNTVVVIEHNLDVIKTADWIVDLGPEAGDEGGWIVAAGTPEQIVEYADNWSRVEGRESRAGKLSVESLELRGKKKRRDTKSLNSKHSTLNLRRSHTGEMLAPVLAGAKRTEREIFDADEAGKKREGDVDLRQIGRGAKMPWQKDGRRWHTVDRVAHNGSACNWEGSALERVIDTLEANEGFDSVNWKERAVVEVTGKVTGKAAAGATWFLHAMTGDEWLLTLKFRVGRNTFRQDELRERFDLKPLDDLDELPVYGRGNRVKAKNLKGPWQEVSITVHWLKEIETPEFAEFLQEACDSYLKQVNQAKLNPADLTPWKVLGQKWHLSRKGFPSNKRVNWDAKLLETVFDTLEQTLPNAKPDYGNKQVVYFRIDDQQDAPLVAVHTKRRGGVDVSLYAKPGQYALGRIASLGSDRDITTDKNGNEVVKIRFEKTTQLKSAELRKLLEDHAK